MILDIVRMINDGSISKTKWELVETIKIYDYDVFVLKINSKRVNKVENIVKKRKSETKKELENKLHHAKKNLEIEIPVKQKPLRGSECEGAYGAANAAWDNYCQGELTSSDGTKYVGEFLGHIKNGKGTLTYSNGNIYVGDFENNNAHGIGVLTYTDGSEEVGIFEENVYVGKE